MPASELISENAHPAENFIVMKFIGDILAWQGRGGCWAAIDCRHCSPKIIYGLAARWGRRGNAADLPPARRRRQAGREHDALEAGIVNSPVARIIDRSSSYLFIREGPKILVIPSAPLIADEWRPLRSASCESQKSSLVTHR